MAQAIRTRDQEPDGSGRRAAVVVYGNGPMGGMLFGRVVNDWFPKEGQAVRFYEVRSTDGPIAGGTVAPSLPDQPHPVVGLGYG